MCKTRLGFVSNSSSSSFILPVDGDSDKFTITITLEDLMRMVENGDESSIDGYISSKDDLDAFIISHYAYGHYRELEEIFENDEYVKERYNELLSILNSGKSVVVGDIDYNDSSLESIIKNAGGKIEN